jgi:hypothetical protein
MGERTAKKIGCRKGEGETGRGEKFVVVKGREEGWTGKKRKK